MTCIIGIEREGTVWLGADSLGVAGHCKATRKDRKVVPITNPAEGWHMAAGVCGSYRLRDVLRWELSLEAPRVGSSIERWVRRDFISALRTATRDGGCLTLKDSVEVLPGNFLVATHSSDAGGQLYMVDYDLQVGNVEPWGHSVGSGCDVAHGVLYSHRAAEDPERVLLEALRAAEALITSVRGPFLLYKLDASGLREVYEGE